MACPCTELDTSFTFDAGGQKKVMEEMLRKLLTPKIVARFWSLVATRPADGCWMWGGSKGDYSSSCLFSIGTVRISAKKIAWFLAGGAVDDDTVIRSGCTGNISKLCVRPSHLTNRNTLALRHEQNRMRELEVEKLAKERGVRPRDVEGEVLAAWRAQENHHAPPNGLPRSDEEVLILKI